MTRKQEEDQSPIIFYYLEELVHRDVFCKLLAQRFRERGHERKIEFRLWDCYGNEPGRDGDLFAYDGMVMSALVKKGFLHQLPDIIDISGVFDWIYSGSRVRGQVYGIPFMLCGSFLICHRRDYIPFRNAYDLRGGLTTTLCDAILPYLYLYAFCNYQEGDQRALEAVSRFYQMNGGEKVFNRTNTLEENLRRFIDGECRYLLGFSEDIRYLPPDDYAVEPINVSDNARNEMPFLFCDYISMGSKVAGEKLLDCLDLMEIMVDPDFVFDICMATGKPQYMIPADRRVYPRLMEIAPVYQDLYQIVSNPENLVMRYGEDFYTDFPRFKEELVSGLKNGKSR